MWLDRSVMVDEGSKEKECAVPWWVIMRSKLSVVSFSGWVDAIMANPKVVTIRVFTG